MLGPGAGCATASGAHSSGAGASPSLVVVVGFSSPGRASSWHCFSFSISSKMTTLSPMMGTS